MLKGSSDTPEYSRTILPGYEYLLHALQVALDERDAVEPLHNVDHARVVKLRHQRVEDVVEQLRTRSMAPSRSRVKPPCARAVAGYKWAAAAAAAA